MYRPGSTPGFDGDRLGRPELVTAGQAGLRRSCSVVRRLDGLPLAIELAAARVKLLPAEAILPRLEHSLGLLTGDSRDPPDRLQTLRATIGWSYDLLTEGARRLLDACSVFAGGAGLEVIETVCDAAVDIGLPVLDGLQELIDQSLLRQVHNSGCRRRVTRCWRGTATGQW
jgi:predicted ATPase